MGENGLLRETGRSAPDREVALPSGQGSSDGEPTGIVIAAFDGGGTTGTAIYDNGIVTLGQIKKPRVNAYRYLRGLPPVSCLAYEWFVARQGVKEDHADVMYINGAIEAEADRRGVPFYRYLPRTSKSRVSDDTLKELGWWPGLGLRTGGHAADAARILLCTLTDEYPSELMRHDA